MGLLLTRCTSSTCSRPPFLADLHPEVQEAMLFSYFSPFGSISSVRICRDHVTRKSLGYAYVNFVSQEDAEKAMKALNYTDIKGRKCRIMWKQRDPYFRRAGIGNVFVKVRPPPASPAVHELLRRLSGQHPLVPCPNNPCAEPAAGCGQ